MGGGRIQHGRFKHRTNPTSWRECGSPSVHATVTVTLVENVPANGFRIRYYDNQGTPAELVPGGTPAALTAAQRACVQKVAIQVESEIPDPYPDKPNLHSKVRSGVTIRNRWISTSY